MENNRRRYLRLNKIFPVEIKIVNSKNEPISDLMQGFTRDVSFSGVCVEINSLKPEHIRLLKDEQNKLQIFLNIPLKQHPVKAIARMAWFKQTASPYPQSCLLGLAYEVIDKQEQKRIIGFARLSKRMPQLITLGCIALVIFCGYLGFENTRLARSNRMLIGQLGQLHDEQFGITQELDKIKTEKLVLSQMIKQSAVQRQQMRDKIMGIEKLNADKAVQDSGESKQMAEQKEQLQSQLAGLIEENRQMEKRLKAFDSSEEVLQYKLKKVTSKKEMLEDRTLDLMKQWLIACQSSKTGLVVSYDNDHSLLDVGYTYDQALSAFNFINAGKYEKAGMIFDFYTERAEKIDGGYANAYDVATGKVAEYIVHTGPVIYLGLAAIRYEQSTGDKKYTGLVDDIGQWLIRMQNKKQDGSLPGGPKLKWSATEQNIAAYVFFKAMFKQTNNLQYAEASRKVYEWIKEKAFNKKLKRFNRGTEDFMIATDTIALSILAFGPEGLEDMGIDVDDLVRCVEDNCKTKVDYKNAAGEIVEVSGFDFCAPSSIGRSGAISVEWTAQMVLAFRKISDYYIRADQSQAKKYEKMADYYLGELEKLLLVRSSCSSSKGWAGLPYSSTSLVDTGHGWHTPNNQAISAASTNFAIFAKEEYNIF
jgi:hypothetical protein